MWYTSLQNRGTKRRSDGVQVANVKRKKTEYEPADMELADIGWLFIKIICLCTESFSLFIASKLIVICKMVCT